MPIDRVKMMCSPTSASKAAPPGPTRLDQKNRSQNEPPIHPEPQRPTQKMYRTPLILRQTDITQSLEHGMEIQSSII